MGNTCCCDEDLTSRPVDPNVLVWRPEALPGKRNVTSAELQKRDEMLDAALDRIARHQPDEPSPRQSVPRAAEVAEFRRSQLSQRLTDAERGFQEARPHHQIHRPPEKIGEDIDSNEDLAAPSDTSCPQGEVPQHEVQWVTEYHGDAAPASLQAARPSSPASLPLASPVSTVSPAVPRQSTASEGRHAEPKETQETLDTPGPPRAAAPAVPAALPRSPAPAAPAQEVTGAKPAQAPAEPASAASAPAEAEAEDDDDIPLLPMKFQLPDKSFQDVYFFAFPIGFDLGKQTPLTVRGVKAGSYAEQLGVQPGWKICEIGGVKVAHLKPKDMLAVLAEQKKKHLG